MTEVTRRPARPRWLLGELGELDPLTTVVGLLSLSVILVLKRYLPLVPASLVVVLAAIAAP